MFTLVITEKGGAQRKLEFDKPEITIGRVTGNDIVLPKGNVSKRHSRIVLKDGRYIVVDLKSTNGTYVNGRKITSPLVIKPGDKVYIGDFIISLDGGEGVSMSDPGHAPPPDDARPAAPPPIRSTGGAVAPRPPGPPPVRASQQLDVPVQPRQSMPQPTPAPAPQAPRLSSVPPPVFPPVSSESSVESLDDDSDDAIPTPIAARPVTGSAVAPQASQHGNAPPRTQESAQLHATMPAPQPSALPQAAPARIATGVSQARPAPAARAAAPIGTSAGGDPIDSLVSDARVLEIVIESPSRIVVDVGMGLEDAPFTYASVASLDKAIHRIFAAANAEIHHGAAVYEAGGESWNVYLIRSPESANSPMLVLRRVSREFVNFDALVARGTISADDVEGLKSAIYERRNVLVSGPSTRAVSPVLAALAALAAERERVVAIETAPSMGIPRAMHLYLAAKTASNFRDALQKARVLRADRIVIEEIEGSETYDALLAMAGRRGSLASVFAGSGGEALSHLQMLVGLDGRVSAENAQVLVQRAVGLVIHVDLDESGSPVVEEIARVG